MINFVSETGKKYNTINKDSLRSKRACRLGEISTVITEAFRGNYRINSAEPRVNGGCFTLQVCSARFPLFHPVYADLSRNLFFLSLKYCPSFLNIPLLTPVIYPRSEFQPFSPGTFGILLLLAALSYMHYICTYIHVGT